MVLGLLGSGDAQDKARDIRKILMQMQRRQNLRYTQAQGYQLEGLEGLRKGYDESITNVGRVGLASKMGIEAAGQQTQGKIAQSYTSRGLSNSTAMGSTQALAGGQTAQALAGVDQAVAAAKGNLVTAKGHALNQAYGGLSALQQNREDAESQLQMMLAQLRASTPSRFEESLKITGSLMDIFGSIYGMGGGLGGGGGYAGGSTGTPIGMFG